jgi:hypothetical protein
MYAEVYMRCTPSGGAGALTSVPDHVPVRLDNRVPAVGSRGVETPLLKFNKVENATPFPTN